MIGENDFDATQLAFDEMDSFMKEDAPKTAMDELMEPVKQMVSWDTRVKELEQDLANAKKSLSKYSREILPNLMKQHNVNAVDMTYTDVTGKVEDVHVSLKDKIEVSLPKTDDAKREKALSFIASNGGMDIIKDAITVEDLDDDIISLLQERGIVFTRKRDINGNSLAAWFREKLGLKKGTIRTMDPSIVPAELNLFQYTEANVS